MSNHKYLPITKEEINFFQDFVTITAECPLTENIYKQSVKDKDIINMEHLKKEKLKLPGQLFSDNSHKKLE